ncbi:hypothetical protein [Bradyrhizobium lablabi]|uniref:hypothetical protein n=1 Tax=Bradyrhizobium lablabi TaxID=722472 RepID=UPI001BA88952|nr:hypothetical protein [Bradyrhizobium lablabi]MBR0696675.1 hypothetical protein [Bradyrhizobium lablabi]
MPNKGRATAANAHAQAREDILNPHAISTLSAGAVSAMSAVGAAVIKKNKAALSENADWFWHMFAKCEAKAARIAEQAARNPDACGDATFIELYAKNLPKLMASALEAHEKALRAK